MKLRARQRFGSIATQAAAASGESAAAAGTTTAAASPATTGAKTLAQLQQLANVAIANADASGTVPSIVDTGGSVTIIYIAPTSIAGEAAASKALTASQKTRAVALANDAYGIQQLHTNTALASNSSPYLATGIADKGAVGAAPSYITTLPQWPKSKGSQNAGTFPYPNPPPHWTTNLKWWTGQTLLNVGAPKYSNDPWEYLRSALVDSNQAMLKNWIVWFLAEVGKPATTVWANAQPWAQALASLDLSQSKYIMTSEGAVFLPFSYADLMAMQATTKSYEYPYSAATLANYLMDWVTQVLPDVAEFPIAVRLNPGTASPYGSNYLPAMYRVGSTFLAQLAPYLPILAIASAGALLWVLAPASGVASAAAAAADTTSAATAATDALSASAAAELTAGDVLPEVLVSSTAVAADAGATTALTAVAAAGASTVAAASASGTTAPTPDEDTTLPEVDVTATPITTPAPITGTLGLPAADLSAAEAANAQSQVNLGQQTNPPHPSTPSNSTIGSALSALAKLLGGGGLATGSAADGTDGLTGTGGDTLGDWLGNLTSSDWLLILAAGATGLYFVHRSRPHRKPVKRVKHA